MREETLPDGVRIVHSAPTGADFDPRRPNHVLIYALPNGNNIEHTWGAQLTPDLDPRFDIQHVAAQTRLLRRVTPDENIFLVLVEAEGRSWPALRAKRSDNAALIAAIVKTIRASVPGAPRVTLAAHSGGGSFIFGLINHGEIGGEIDRIAFLDANYAYDSAQGHGDKLQRWLQGDARRQLVVVAYDDRKIAIDGKLVVGPDGGTWRASGRMMAHFQKTLPLQTVHGADFDIITAIPGAHPQIALYLHRNPDNAILHTRLVGEMNGLLMATTFGTPRQAAWGSFGGPRAYTDFVQATPRVALGKKLPNIPPRAADAMGGAQFLHTIAGLSGEEREAAIAQQILAGNVPDFLRRLRAVTAVGAPDSAGVRRQIVFYAMPDYLAVG
ncbi:MAG TPA: hypothetical protein VIT92_11305, partial [Burkholderiaceae bacterium]